MAGPKLSFIWRFHWVSPQSEYIGGAGAPSPPSPPSSYAAPLVNLPIKFCNNASCETTYSHQNRDSRLYVMQLAIGIESHHYYVMNEVRRVLHVGGIYVHATASLISWLSGLHICVYLMFPLYVHVYNTVDFFGILMQLWLCLK